MPAKEDLRATALRYAQMADECTDPATACLLRLLAADYLEAAYAANAGASTVQQQQQTQPKEPKTQARDSGPAAVCGRLAGWSYSITCSIGSTHTRFQRDI